MIFVDTWAWIALAVMRDQHHLRAVAEHERLRSERRRYVTTSFVLSEVITQLYRVSPVASAEAFAEALFEAIQSGDYQLVHINEAQFERAWNLRRRYRDKPQVSLTDFTSFVVMQELGIADVFTGDSHFASVGMGFRIFPS